jgi:glycine/D-amino acid oxidase-like deaminating enzyme
MAIQGHSIPISADVVIIGGGVVGTAIALFLARRGIRPCLVERADIGAGTTSAAAAAALMQTKTSPGKLALAKSSLAMLEQLHGELDPGFEFRRSGSLLAACSEAELSVVQDMNARLRGLGLDVQLLDGPETRDWMPVLGPSAIGGSLSPGDAQISPLELVLSYATAASRLGAIICTRTEMTGIVTKGSRILAVETSAGRIATEIVVDAAGVWSTQVARMAGFELPITPLKGELLISAPMPRMMQGTLISARYLLSKASAESARSAGSNRTVGITLVQVEHGNFVVGATREPAGLDRRSTAGGIGELTRLLVDITPCLANLQITRAYAGLRPITPDSLPIIGPMPGLPQFIIASGHGGDGLILSPITATLVAEIVSGEADPARLAPYASSRFEPQGAQA